MIRKISKTKVWSGRPIVFYYSNCPEELYVNQLQGIKLIHRQRARFDTKSLNSRITVFSRYCWRTVLHVVRVLVIPQSTVYSPATLKYEKESFSQTGLP